MTELLGDLPDERLVDLLLERCRGEPLFIELLLADLIDRRPSVGWPDGHWYLESDDPTELPASLAALLLARLDRLPSVAGDLVLLAAVLGLECSRSDLAAFGDGVASGTDAAAAPDPDHAATVEVVIAAGILDEQPDRPGSLRFRHGLVRDAAYETQPIARLIELHAAAADVLAETGAPPAMVADHLERAGRNAEAVPYLHAAATESRRLASPAETRRFLERAYRLDEGLTGSTSRSAELPGEIAECAMAMGDYQGAAASARVALSDTFEPNGRSACSAWPARHWVAPDAWTTPKWRSRRGSECCGSWPTPAWPGASTPAWRWWPQGGGPLRLPATSLRCRAGSPGPIPIRRPRAGRPTGSVCSPCRRGGWRMRRRISTPKTHASASWTRSSDGPAPLTAAGCSTWPTTGRNRRRRSWPGPSRCSNGWATSTAWRVPSTT